MPAPPALSVEQIAALRADLAAGRQPTVWFTPAAVGVDTGRSARLVALDTPAEGDFIQVRPAGSTDVLSFSANELTLSRPPRRPRAAPPGRPAHRAADRAADPAPEPAPDRVADRATPAERRPGRPRRQPAGAAEPGDAPAAAERTAGRATRSRSRPPGPLTVTVGSTESGEWTVEVLAGTRRVVRRREVAAPAVLAAARALGADVADAIDGVLAAVRDQQRARVAQLQAELDAARQALAALSGDD